MQLLSSRSGVPVDQESLDSESGVNLGSNGIAPRRTLPTLSSTCAKISPMLALSRRDHFSPDFQPDRPRTVSLTRQTTSRRSGAIPSSIRRPSRCPDLVDLDGTILSPAPLPFLQRPTHSTFCSTSTMVGAPAVLVRGVDFTHAPTWTVLSAANPLLPPKRVSNTLVKADCPSLAGRIDTSPRSFPHFRSTQSSIHTTR